jgi:uncharacterized protein (DUF1501 family)
LDTTRREFLRAGAIAALGLTAPLDMLAAAPPRIREEQDPIVVTVSLIGGNDGLNTVVPLRQYGRYRALRPYLAWPRGWLIRLAGYEADFGLAPGMQALAHLFAQGKVALINGCGCPPTAAGLFDHEASMRNFWTGETYGAAPPETPTGWLGRFLDGIASSEFPAAVDFGSAPLVFTGARAKPLSLGGVSGFGVFPSADAAARYRAYERIQQLPAAPGVAQRNQALRRQILALSGVLQDIADAYEVAPGVQYPSNALSWELQDCAALIAANRGVRALGVSLSGFDTHAVQNFGVPDSLPYHQVLLTTVSEAVGAFYADLKGHGVSDRVVTLVFSEFGRRAAENSERGTDHGFGGPMLVIGDPVKGGVYGDYPDLREESLVLGGNLDAPIDYRSVYATILAQHLGADPEPILRGSFPQLPFV